MVKLLQKDQSQFSELLYNSVMMIKEKNQVTEKILNLTLEIICLLTGEDCVVVKKRSEHDTDSSSLIVPKVFCRPQSPISEPPPNSLTYERGNGDKNIIRPLNTEVPLRSEDVAIYLSVEEWKYLEEHKELYKDVIKENPQTRSSVGCENVNPEITRHESDSDLSVTDHQDSKEKRIHPDTSAGESVKINTSESCHVSPHLQESTKEDNQITQEYQVEPEDLSPDEWEEEEEEIPIEISTDECNNSNTSEKCHIPPYPQDCPEKDNRLTQDYQIEPGDGIFPQQCKEKKVPTEVRTGESSNRNTPETCPFPPNSQDFTEEDKMITEDYPAENSRLRNTTGTVLEASPAHVEPGDGIVIQKFKVEDIDNEMSTAASSVRNVPESSQIPSCSQDCMEEESWVGWDYQMEPQDRIFPQQCKEEEIPTEIGTGSALFQPHSVIEDFSTCTGSVSLARERFMEKSSVSRGAKFWDGRQAFIRADIPEFHDLPGTGYGTLKGEPVSWETQPEGRHISISDSKFVMDNMRVAPDYQGINFVSVKSDEGPVLHEEFKCTGFLEQQTGSEHSATINMYSEANTSAQIMQEDLAGTYTCKLCGISFSNDFDFQLHQRTHTEDTIYACFQCKTCFTNNSDLVTHQRIHKGECGKNIFSKPNQPTQENIHTRKKHYECSACGQSFSQATDLVKHLKIHTEGKAFACPVCGKCFSYKSHLDTHHRIHTGEKPYVCSICGKSFTQSAHHLAHKRIHTGEKPFSCSECGKCFTRRSTLRSHQTIHSRPFICLVCGKCFVTKEDLAEHYQDHSGEKLVPGP